MMVALPLLPIVVYFIQYSVPPEAILPVFTIFAIVGFSGFGLVLYFGMGSSMLLHSLKQLKKLSPPEPMLVSRHVVLNRNPVYVIGQWGSNTIYFVAFHQPERIFDSKLRVPRLVWTWEYRHQIGDLKVARREGKFTVPVEEGMYLSGEGIIYSLRSDRGARIRIRIDFSAEQLSQIIDHLSDDISSSLSQDSF